jgi:hypothetical protein
MKTYTNNESAASGVFAMVAAFLFFGIMAIALGAGYDRIVQITIGTAGGAVSQMRMDTLNTILLIMQFEPFVFFIGAGISTWVNANRSSSGDVPVGKLIFAGGETMVLTLLIMAFTSFGGMAIEAITDGTMAFSSVNPDIALFGAVQYVLPLFYGIMVIATIGLVIQYLIVCVQDVEYTGGL